MSSDVAVRAPVSPLPSRFGKSLACRRTLQSAVDTAAEMKSVRDRIVSRRIEAPRVRTPFMRKYGVAGPSRLKKLDIHMPELSKELRLIVLQRLHDIDGSDSSDEDYGDEDEDDTECDDCNKSRHAAEPIHSKQSLFGYSGVPSPPPNRPVPQKPRTLIGFTVISSDSTRI